MSALPEDVANQVLRAGELPIEALGELLSRFGLRSVVIEGDTTIPGSYWGESEAGLICDTVYWRVDTPVHSILHEACHAICMDSQRRAGLDRDAGGDYAEENAVCYLQIILADELPGVGRARMFQDMDAWGYTFRLGSAQAWFEQDAKDARDWLALHGLIDERDTVTWTLRP